MRGVKTMRIEKVESRDITSLIKDFDNHIIYYFDSLKFGKGQVEVDIDNINEAFFFKKEKCLHIYREDGTKGLLYIEEPDSEFILEEQILEDGISKEHPKALIVKKHIEYDDDGQAYISRTLPSAFI